MNILHGFADCGVEGEALSVYGDVVRATINPRENEHSDVLMADLSGPDELPFEEGGVRPCRDAPAVYGLQRHA